MCVFVCFSSLTLLQFEENCDSKIITGSPKCASEPEELDLKTVSVTYKNIVFLAQISLSPSLLATGHRESQNYKERCSQVSYYHRLFPRKNHKIE